MNDFRNFIFMLLFCQLTQFDSCIGGLFSSKKSDIFTNDETAEYSKSMFDFVYKRAVDYDKTSKASLPEPYKNEPIAKLSDTSCQYKQYAVQRFNEGYNHNPQLNGKITEKDKEKLAGSIAFNSMKTAVSDMFSLLEKRVQLDGFVRWIENIRKKKPIEYLNYTHENEAKVKPEKKVDESKARSKWQEYTKSFFSKLKTK